MSTALEILPPQESEPQLKQVAIWEPFEEKLAKLQMTALTLRVTDISQTSEMKLARATRLTLRELRIAIEHRRKELGEYHLRETQRINAGAKTLKDLIEPLEERLLEQEEFIERAAAKERAERNTARSAELRPFVTDPSVYNLADLAEQDYQELLAMCKNATEQRRIAAEKIEAERLAKAKLEAEERERIRQENERLKKEAQEREQAAQVEREKAEAERMRLQRQADADRAKAQKEREAIEAKAKAEREKAAEAARLAAEKSWKDLEAAEAVAQKEREARQRLEAEHKAAQAKAAKVKKASADALWNTTPAPKDRPIVAIGGIAFEDQGSKSKVPFCNAIQWIEEHKDWMLYPENQFCLRTDASEEVLVHLWLDYPTDVQLTEGAVK